MADYAHPETLVSTDWVAQHGNDKNVRVVEVDVDTKAYDEGHVPAPGSGSIGGTVRGARRRAQPWRVQRRDSVASRIAGDLPAGRPYSRSAQYSVGQSLQ